MKSIPVSYSPAAANLIGFASNVTGDTWPLTANDSGDSVAHKLTIRNDSATNHSAKTALITGAGPSSEPQTETVNLPGASATITSTKYWSRVDSVVPSVTIGADTMDIGWAADAVSPPVNLMASAPVAAGSIGIGCTVVSGSPTYGLEVTYDGLLWFAHPTLAGETTSQDGVISIPCVAARIAWTVVGEVSAAFVVPHM